MSITAERLTVIDNAEPSKMPVTTVIGCICVLSLQKSCKSGKSNIFAKRTLD